MLFTHGYLPHAHFAPPGVAVKLPARVFSGIPADFLERPPEGSPPFLEGTLDAITGHSDASLN